MLGEDERDDDVVSVAVMLLLIDGDSDEVCDTDESIVFEDMLLEVLSEYEILSDWLDEGDRGLLCEVKALIDVEADIDGDGDSDCDKLRVCVIDTEYDSVAEADMVLDPLPLVLIVSDEDADSEGEIEVDGKFESEMITPIDDD
jgi:hypothetical protein